MPAQQQDAPQDKGAIVRINMDQQVKDKATFGLILAQSKKKFDGLTGPDYPIERVMRLAMTAVDRQRGILECTARSVVDSVVRAAELRLDFTGATGQAYIIPFRDKGLPKAQLVVGYRGMIDLCTRNKRVLSVQSRAVFAKERFEINYGTADAIVHVPSLVENRGDFVGVYAVAKLRGGVTQFDFMSAADIEETRRRSRAKEQGPWKTDFIEMAKKTVVRRLSKNLPMSIDDGDFDTPFPQPGGPDADDRETTTPEQRSIADLPEVAEPAAPAGEVIEAEVINSAPPRADRSGSSPPNPAPAVEAVPARVEPAPAGTVGGTSAGEGGTEDAWNRFEADFWSAGERAGVRTDVATNAMAKLYVAHADGREPDAAALSSVMAAINDGRFDWEAATVRDPSPPATAPIPYGGLADMAAFRAAWDAVSARIGLDPDVGWRSVAAAMAKRRRTTLESAAAADRRAMLDEYGAWGPDKVKAVTEKAEAKRRENAAKAPAQPAPPPAKMTLIGFRDAMFKAAEVRGVKEAEAKPGIEAWLESFPTPPDFIEEQDFLGCLESAKAGRFDWRTGEETHATA